MTVDKSLMKDSTGRYLTQSIFLEILYNDKVALYTLKDDDHMHRGKLFPSLKKLYLAHEDPTEYSFAITHLAGWQHWQRICSNAQLGKHVDEWREELELKLRSQAVRDIIDNSADGSYQASKWLADRGWDKQPVGRPSKSDKIKEAKLRARVDADFAGDVKRMSTYTN